MQNLDLILEIYPKMNQSNNVKQLDIIIIILVNIY